MVLERVLHHEPQAPLDALDALDDPLDIEIEVGQVAAELLEPLVDVVCEWGCVVLTSLQYKPLDMKIQEL